MTERASHGRGVRDFAVPATSIKPLVWRGGAAESIVRRGAAAIDFRLRSNRHAVYFTDKAPAKGAVYVDGATMNFRPRLRQMDAHPAGSEVTGWCSFEEQRYLVLFLDPEFLLKGAGLEHVQGCTLKPYRDEGDRLSWSLADAIRAECEAGAPHGLLYAETAATMLSVHLLRHHSTLDPRRIQRARGGLAPYQLRRVTEHIGDRIADELSLEELSGLIGLSAHHFCRAFKQSTGLPPHRWQMRRRVERAQDLMLTTELRLSDVALACGFSDQSHFTTVFRKAVGATPSAWRRARRA